MPGQCKRLQAMRSCQQQSPRQRHHRVCPSPSRRARPARLRPTPLHRRPAGSRPRRRRPALLYQPPASSQPRRGSRPPGTRAAFPGEAGCERRARPACPLEQETQSQCCASWVRCQPLRQALPQADCRSSGCRSPAQLPRGSSRAPRGHWPAPHCRAGFRACAPCRRLSAYTHTLFCLQKNSELIP